MALAETTLNGAVAQADNFITLTSATSMAPNRIIQVDGEVMQANKMYSSGTAVNVQRGLYGTSQVAHTTLARVVHGDAADWSAPGAGNTTGGFTPFGRTTRIRSYRTTATMDLPLLGEDLIIRLDSTAFTTTVPVPTKDLDGARITFIGVGGAAYVLSFTGGLGGAGAGYTTFTFNATGAISAQFIAMDETWRCFAQIPVAGTVTNVTATLT